jgi:nucleoid-associated protein YgaU
MEQNPALDDKLKNAQLRIGNFVFEKDEFPEEINLGGEQMLAILQFPGGFKEVQSFGALDSNPVWTGTFCFENALARAQTVEAMFRTGNVFDFQLEQLPVRPVVIKKFNWSYRTASEIPYEIELERVTTIGSLLETDPVTAANLANFTQSIANPKGLYTVVQGDTLWGLAQRFYGNGELYKKIAEENKINNPDLILPGQRLVIP